VVCGQSVGDAVSPYYYLPPLVYIDTATWAGGAEDVGEKEKLAVGMRFIHIRRKINMLHNMRKQHYQPLRRYYFLFVHGSLHWRAAQRL
jgi:hypothetical protein